MAAINPGVVLGTLLDPHHTSSTELILRMLRRSYPGCARVHWMLVDVGDVAEAHLRAMTSPQAAGERFCCISEILWMTEMARILNTHFKDRGLTISERTLPDGVMRLYTLFDAKARDALSSIGLEKRISNHKLISLLGRQPRRMEGSIIETAESLVRFGLV
jgi:dihydroflavonol-4-reductase